MPRPCKEDPNPDLLRLETIELTTRVSSFSPSAITTASLPTRTAGPGSFAVLNGFSSPDDGGGGTFTWSATSTATPDGGTVFIGGSTVGGVGRWIRDVAALGVGYNVCWFGADRFGNTDSLAAINACLAAASRAGSGSQIVYFPAGTYLISAGFAVTLANAGITLEGAGASPQTGSPLSRIKLTANSQFLFQCNLIRGCIDNIWFDGNHHANHTFEAIGLTSTTEIKRLTISGCVPGTGILFDAPNSLNPDRDNITVEHCIIEQDPDGSHTTVTPISSAVGGGATVTINSTASITVGEVVLISGNSLLGTTLYKAETSTPGVSITVRPLSGTYVGTVTGGTVTQLDWAGNHVATTDSNCFLTTFKNCYFTGAYTSVSMLAGSFNFLDCEFYQIRDVVFSFEVTQPFTVERCYSEQLAGALWVRENSTAGVNVNSSVTFRNNQVNDPRADLQFVCKQPVTLQDNVFTCNVNVSPATGPYPGLGVYKVTSIHNTFNNGKGFIGTGAQTHVDEIDTEIPTYAYAIASAITSGGTCTVTTVGSHSLPATTPVTITGNSVANGTWTIATVTPTTFTFALAGSATATGGLATGPFASTSTSTSRFATFMAGSGNEAVILERDPSGPWAQIRFQSQSRTKQTDPVSDNAGLPLFFQGTNPFPGAATVGGKTPGNIQFDFPAPLSGGREGLLQVSRAAGLMLGMGGWAGTAGAGGALYFGPTASANPTLTNVGLSWDDGVNLYINAGSIGHLRIGGADVVGWQTGVFYPTTDNTVALGSAPGNRWSTVYTAGLGISGPIVGTNNVPVQFGALGGSALSVATATIDMTSTQPRLQSTIVQLTGAVNGGGCTVKLPNNVGAMFFFDTTGVTGCTVGNPLIFSTGSGTAATVSAIGANGKFLLTVVVVASNFVSAGGA